MTVMNIRPESKRQDYQAKDNAGFYQRRIEGKESSFYLFFFSLSLRRYLAIESISVPPYPGPPLDSHSASSVQQEAYSHQCYRLRLAFTAGIGLAKKWSRP